MDLSNRLNRLDRLYAIYDDCVGDLVLACKKKCAHCCTGNVTATTLEGYKIVDHFASIGMRDWPQVLQSLPGKTRYQPLTTTNTIADYCRQGRQLPDEDMPPTAGPCPFLQNDQCPLYAVRPFGCRCMISRHNCGETGFAETDAWVMSLNTVFLQVIEHIDRQGCTGSLTDILLCLAVEKNRNAYRAASLACAERGLISNRKLSVLMIPPEHREQIEPVLRILGRITS